ncbi:unnamed protein product [Phyllotreta striolata]|uniref:Nuclear transcription factor Y subunit beta n=1 Tax=Phyllotreta striolata TaxID=444603 RepID=A0A9N9TZY0_PHYSR|nr:unnamed protein product [Phyllotreta striolata]
MEKVEDMTHSYALAPLTDQYMVQVEDMEDEHDQLKAENTDDSNHDGDKTGIPLREQDRFLPIANVAKIMKKAIPDTGKVTNKIAKDARECVQECVSEFISFITSEASERCHMEKRKTINGEDILVAMSTLGFDNYIEPLKVYLQKYREAAKSDKNLTGDGLYEEVSEEAFNSSGTNLLTSENGSTETVLYAYQDSTNTIQQFQLG